MLKLYNKEHVAVGALTNLKDYKIEYLLSGEDLLEFSLSICDEDINLVKEEGYVRNKDNEYVIKAVDPSQNFKRFSCIVNIEDIKAKSIKNFEISNNTITEAIRLAIAGTGWILSDNNINKRRTVRVKNTDALGVLREIRRAFMIDYRFDAINKVIYVYEHFGSDKGVYFSDELNLKTLTVPSDTYDYATRLYCYGKDGINIASINGGKEYVENFQYSNKVIEKIWTDDRYTVAENLKADAEAKLNEISKPKRSYKAEIIDLARNNKEYKFLDFFLGDTITLLSKAEKFRDKQRIVKYIEYPNDPSKNTCELGNTRLTFEELQKENEAKNQVVNNVTTDNGTIKGSTIDEIETSQIKDFNSEVIKVTNIEAVNANIQHLTAQYVTITGKLTAVEAEIGTLTANVATIDKLTVTHSAYIRNLQASKAEITQFNAVNATIQVLEANVGKIETLVNGNLSSENIQAGGITSDKLTIANGFIKNAMIDRLDVSKVNAGDISTNKFKIKSDDGGIEIVGATQQFKDKNNKVRIQMGKDTQGNFNFIIRGEDGTTTLIDHTGVKEKAIADDLIKSNMIASDSVGEKQIDYNSFSKGFNKDTNTTTLKATKIRLDNQNQSLEVAFNSLKTQADGTKSMTESHSTTIGVIQGQISTAINNTIITKDGQTILLKDDYNRTVSTVDSMKSTIGGHTTQINQHTGQITGVETRVNTVERDLNSITARVSSTETAIENVKNYKTIYARGTGKDFPGNALVKIEDKIILNGQSRGLTIITLNPITLEMISKNSYDTFGDLNAIVNFVSKINQLNEENYIIVVTSQDSSKIYDSSICEALYKIGASALNKKVSYREAYALIGKSRLGKGNGVEMYIPSTSDDKRFAEVAVKVSEGAFLGVNSNNYGAALDEVSTEITTTKNKVASVEVDLSNITSKVSSVETTTSNILNASSQNLLYNADFRILNGNNADEWIVADSNRIKLDANTTLLDGCSSYYFNVTGLTEDKWLALYSPFIQAKSHEKFTASIYVTIIDSNSFDRGASLEIEYFNSSNERIKIYGTVFDYNKRGWHRLVVHGVAPEGTTKVRIRVHPVRNGKFNVSKPMLQLGEIATGWQKGFDVNKTEVRLKSAEQKITDSSIISTVSSQFYKKGETDSRYAAQAQIIQLANQISSKVDVNGVVSTIRQNPGAVQFGFNGIDARVEITNDGMFFKNNAAKNILSIKRGYMHLYNQYDSSVMGGLVPRTTLGGQYWDNGVSCMSSHNSYYFSIAKADDWINDTQATFTPREYLVVNFRDRGSDRMGIHTFAPLYAHDGINLMGKAIINADTITANNLSCISFRHPNGNEMFSSDGFNMSNKRNWNWNNCNILDPVIIGGSINGARVQMSYSLASTSPGGSVGADTASVETMLLQEDFSKYDELNNAVLVNMNEGFKYVYENNKKLENENEQLKLENKNLKEELSMTKNALDTILMS